MGKSQKEGMRGLKVDNARGGQESASPQFQATVRAIKFTFLSTETVAMTYISRSVTITLLCLTRASTGDADGGARRRPDAIDS